MNYEALTLTKFRKNLDILTEGKQKPAEDSGFSFWSYFCSGKHHCLDFAADARKACPIFLSGKENFTPDFVNSFDNSESGSPPLHCHILSLTLKFPLGR
jgi:hypothetical protein